MSAQLQAAVCLIFLVQLKEEEKTEVSNSEKVKQVTALYNTLGVKELAIKEANKHTDIALKHLEELEANTAKKNSLKEFALHLLNREV